MMTHSTKIIMANPADRLPPNVPGRYYVGSQCIDCDLCRETAPTVFARHDESGKSYVQKQPETTEETESAEEALRGCPVEAIGNDGGDAP
jgi:ferredoxin